jgi:aminopeptidase
MADQRMVNLAKVLVNYSVGVNPGDFVSLECIGSLKTCLPFLQEIFREILQAGGQPHIIVNPELVEEFDYIFLKNGSDEQLSFLDPTSDLLYDQLDCMIGIYGPANTRALSQIDPERQAICHRAAMPITQKFFSRSATGDLRWCYASFPTTGQAQDAEMSLEEFEDYVYSTTYADTEDPVARWLEQQKQQQNWIARLAGGDQVRVSGKDIDLSFSIKGRTFINCDGKKNMPDGEIFTGPVEDSVNGHIRFSFPCIWVGVEVDGVELTFEKGKVVKA